MPNFYQSLEQLEKYLEKTLIINESGAGIISINDHIVDTNQQFEMLSPAFFAGTAEDNPTIKAYKLLFQRIGILPLNTSEIPLIRDIPLRTKTQNEQAKQQAIFARFLEQDILSNQWSMLFVDEFQELRKEIELCLRTKKPPIARKIVTVDEESGMPLSSGGYVLEQHLIRGIKLWLHQPESQSKKDSSAAIERSLNNTVNNHLIVTALKPKLLEKTKIAFNVRGVSKTISSRQDLQNTALGGGHQHFLMLDRTTKTIYAINDTRGATDEEPRVFKQQIELFLQSLGDRTQYKFEYIQGKSRQPDNKAYISQVCSITQFCHYAAILSGIDVHKIQDTVPAKISTLMYLLQYAYINKDKELFTILDNIMRDINLQIGNNFEILPVVAPLLPNNSNKKVNHPLFSAKDPKAQLSQVKTHFQDHIKILTVIERLEQGSKSYNPYWINSQNKLNCIIDALIDCIDEEYNIDDLLTDQESDLSKAVNMRRLPNFNFFGACKESSVKSREIINEITDECQARR